MEQRAGALDDPLADRQPIPFAAPKGVRMVRIDRRSGRRVYGAWPGDEAKAAVIWEAFKPESEPRRTIRKEEAEEQAKVAATRAASRTRARTDSEFLSDQGGIY